MREGFLPAGINRLEGEERGSIGQTGDLHRVAHHRAAGGGRYHGHGGRRAVRVARDKVDDGRAVVRLQVGVGDRQRRGGITVQVREQAISAGAVPGVAEKGSLEAVGNRINGLGIAELVGGLFDRLVNRVHLGEVPGDVDEPKFEMFLCNRVIGVSGAVVGDEPGLIECVH